jgi:hypothetical protein
MAKRGLGARFDLADPEFSVDPPSAVAVACRACAVVQEESETGRRVVRPYYKGIRDTQTGQYAQIPNTACSCINAFDNVERRHIASLIQKKDLLTHLRSIRFTHAFNSSVNDLLSALRSLQSVTFGSRFNQPITFTLPSSLRSIEFGWDFNQPVVLPNSLQSVKFGWDFNQPIVLPNSLQSVEFGFRFNQPVVLPNSLQSVKFDVDFNQPIVLPNSLQSVEFGLFFNQPVVLPNSLQSVEFGNYFNQPVVLPSSLRSVIFGWLFNQPITVELPSSVQHVEFRGDGFNQPILRLPRSILRVRFGTYVYEGDLQIPLVCQNRVHSIFNDDYYWDTISFYDDEV